MNDQTPNDQTPSRPDDAGRPHDDVTPAADPGREGRAPQRGDRSGVKPHDDDSAMERADAANGEPDAAEE